MTTEAYLSIGGQHTLHLGGKGERQRSFPTFVTFVVSWIIKLSENNLSYNMKVHDNCLSSMSCVIIG